MTLNKEKIVLDCGHDKKCLGVVNYGAGRSERTYAGGGAQDAASKTLKCKTEGCEAVEYFSRRRDAGV